MASKITKKEFMKYLTLDEIINKYIKLELDEKNKLLWSAIDYMEQYNGRTKWYCIAKAMGYENFEGGNDTWYKL